MKATDDNIEASLGWLAAYCGFNCSDGWPDLITLPFPALAFLRWLHAEWNLSDVADRLEVITRWVQAGKPAKLKVIT